MMGVRWFPAEPSYERVMTVSVKFVRLGKVWLSNNYLYFP